MKRFVTILLALTMAFALSAPAMAEDAKQYETTVSHLVSLTGHSVVAFSAKSGLQTVIDSGVMVSGSDSDSSLYVYTQGVDVTASSNKAASATTVSLTTTSSSSVARTGDVIYEITRGDDPGDSTVIFQGVITAHTFSDTGNTDVITRVASDSGGALESGDTVYVGIPLIGVRGAGATSLFQGYVPTTDNATVAFGPGLAAPANSAMANGLTVAATDAQYPNWIFPKGRYGKDYLIVFDSGENDAVDGEIIFVNGHYESVKQ